MCCKDSHEMRKRTKIMIRDGSASCALTCLRCLPQVWQWDCTVYIQQYQHPVSQPFVFHLRKLKRFHGSDFTLIFGTREDLISHLCVMLMRKSSFPRGNFWAFFDLMCFSRYNWVYRYGQLYCYTVAPLSMPVKPVFWYKPPALHYIDTTRMILYDDKLWLECLNSKVAGQWKLKWKVVSLDRSLSTEVHLGTWSWM